MQLRNYLKKVSGHGLPWTLLIVFVALFTWLSPVQAFGDFFWVQTADGTSKFVNARSLVFPNGTLSSDGRNHITYAPAATNLTGTLGVAHGGTGATGTPSNGQIPIGNGTIFALANITGTANRVTVTNGAGTITLSGPQDLASTSSPTFAGPIVTNLFASSYQEITEIADPAAPAATKARLYVRDNGSGKAQIVVRFPTGAVQVIATEP